MCPHRIAPTPRMVSLLHFDPGTSFDNVVADQEDYEVLGNSFKGKQKKGRWEGRILELYKIPSSREELDLLRNPFWRKSTAKVSSKQHVGL